MAAIDRATFLLQAKNYSGTGNWIDESGNGHNATIHGPVHNGEYFTTDGTDDYFEIPDHNDLDFGIGASATMAVKVRVPETPTGSDGLMVKGPTSGSAPGWWFYLPSAFTPRLNLINTSTFATDTGPAFSANTIVTLVARKRVSDTTVEAFTDGSGNGSSSFTDNDTTSTYPIRICAFGSGSFALKCDLFAVAFWAEALSRSSMEMNSPLQLAVAQPTLNSQHLSTTLRRR